ncbi:MAG: dodecin family protein [Candidatus Dadabacteria bacterium]|nr:dodecin family protein [Candidatus Dadabacteria bacterium]
MAVARVTEVIGSSDKSWDDAVREALDRANSTLRGLTGIEVTKMNARIEDGKIAEYRSHVRITFILED